MQNPLVNTCNNKNGRCPHLFLIIITGFFLILLPIPFEKLHSDEVIYWEITRNLANGAGFKTIDLEGPFIGHGVLPFLITAPFLSINSHIFIARFVSALFTIGCSIMIFLLVRGNTKDEKAAFISSILFIFSLNTLRFGGRFYLDPYGLFFFLLSLFLITNDKLFPSPPPLPHGERIKVRGNSDVFKIALSGITAGLSILGRELWLGVYPFYLIYLWKKRKSVLRFFIFSILPFIPFLIYVFVGPGFSYFLKVQAVLWNLKDLLVVGGKGELVPQLFHSWVEFFLLHILTIIGAIWSIKSKRCDTDLLILILPQFLILSMVNGFITNGAFTQYPLGLQAGLALLAGPGILDGTSRLIRWFNKKISPVFLILCVIIAQFIILNILATKVSSHGSFGIHALGWWNDKKVIDLLNEGARGEVIVGEHGAFVKGALKWIWVDRDIVRAIEIEPDWLVTYPNRVRITGEEPDKVKVYHIGPYLVLHSHPPGHMKDVIAPVDFPKWRFRK